MTEQSITCVAHGTAVDVEVSADLFTGLEADFLRHAGKSFAELQEELEILLVRARNGRLRWNKDVKRVKLFQVDLVYELRLNFESLDQALGLRLLFVEDRALRKITVVGLHLKRRDTELSTQRQAQNFDFDQAYKRYREENDDSSKRAT